MTDDPPRYEAISYVWGSSDLTRTVRILGSPGGMVPVTSNLVVALRYLRFPDRSRRVWIDGLCINQQDVIEKGPQVAMMAGIYRLASCVIAWLGPEENGSDRALTVMAEIGSQVEVDWLLQIPICAPDATDLTMFDHKVSLPYGEEDMRSIYYLFSRPWFERLWVRQEILLSSHATVMCGSSSISWVIFRRAWVCLFYKPTNSCISGELQDILRLLQGFLFQAKEVQLHALRSYLGVTKCDDPLDRIYATVNLWSEVYKTLNIKPDYTKRQQKSIKTLSCDTSSGSPTWRYYGNVNSRNHLCPSWVPDWSMNPNDTVSQIMYIFASTPLAAQWTMSKPGHLELSGVNAGTIQRVSKFEVTGLPTYGNLAQAISRILHNEDLLHEYPSGDNRLTAYTRAIFLDGFADTYYPPQSHKQTLSACTKAVLEIAETPQTSELFNRQESPFNKDLLSAVNSYIIGCYFFETMDGYIGSASLELREGDMISVLLGCVSPMVIRPANDGLFRIVGECSMIGIEHGRLLLGPLPPHIRPIKYYDDRRGFWRLGYVDLVKNELTYDPRVKSLPVETDEFFEQFADDMWARLEVDPEVLRSRGVDIQQFVFV